MAIIQARYFVLANGNRPTDCSVDNATKIVAEVIINSEYPVDEEINMLELTIVKAGTNDCVKKFRWQGACGLRKGVTYTIDTPIFGPLLAGSYRIQMGQAGEPLSRSGVGECGINLLGVAC